jgi:hypothetical protein
VRQRLRGRVADEPQGAAEDRGRDVAAAAAALDLLVRGGRELEREAAGLREVVAGLGEVEADDRGGHGGARAEAELARAAVERAGLDRRDVAELHAEAPR